MDIIQFISIFVTLLGGFTFMYKQIKEFRKELQDDIKIQAARSDKLFELIYDTQKNYSDYRKEADQKFYELLKESKK